MSESISYQIWHNRGTQKKIIQAVKSKQADGAITDWILASECGWSFEDIDNADAFRIYEMLIVRKTIQEVQESDAKRRALSAKGKARRR